MEMKPYYNRISLFIFTSILSVTNSATVGTVTPSSLPITSLSSWSSLVPREIKMVMETCMLRSNSGECLQKKVVDFVDRALLKDSIELFDGMTLDKSKYAVNVSEPSARQYNSLTDIVLEKIDRFFNSRVITINFADEGRGKKIKKKDLQYYAVAVGTALALLIPMTLKGLALLAGKALIIAKIALVLAGLAALKHFSQHHGGDSDSHRRVHIEDLADPHPHNLAYSSYAPTQHIA